MKTDFTTDPPGMTVTPESAEDVALLLALGWQEPGDTMLLVRQEIPQSEGLDHLLLVTPFTDLKPETHTIPKGLTVPEQVAIESVRAVRELGYVTKYTKAALTALAKAATPETLEPVAVDPQPMPITPIKVP